MRVLINTFILIIVGFNIIPSSAQSVVWERTIPLLNDQNFTAICNADSGYMAFGQGESPTDFNEILKLDTVGNLLWRKPLGIGTSISFSGDMVKVPNEFNYYVSGDFNIGGFTNDFIAKINSNGNIVWTYTYGVSANYQTWYKLAVLKDKSVLSVGYQQQAGTGEDLFVRRLDSLGNLMWQKIYALPGSQRAYDITEMLDGSLIITGRTGNDLLIVQIGFDGRLIHSITKSYIDNLNFSFCQLNQKNEIIQTGTFTTIGSDYMNLNLFSDTMFLSFDTLGIGSFKANIDSDSNVLVIYSDGAFSRLRYTSIQPKTIIWDLNLMPVPNEIVSPSFSKIDAGGNLIVSGYKSVAGDRDYWIAKISGVGEEWIPDRCSYQPPIAGFDYEYNYPLLTLRDTSSGGLKYLDTVYTWQWTTSNGFNGNEDSLLVFFDTSVNKTIDIELVISNWYGCTDTINQTLVLGETGLEVYKEFEVNIFPNPTKDLLNIQFDNSSGQASFKLYDLQGRLQIVKTLQKDKTIVSLHKLPQGLYIYEIGNANQSRRGKIVKE